MTRRNRVVSSSLVLLLLGAGLPMKNAAAQQKSFDEALVGTWTFVSGVNTGTDGTKSSVWGNDAAGMQIFDNTHHFSSQIVRTTIPKLVSNNRLDGTTDEFKAVAKGILSSFGTYSLENSGNRLVQHIEASSFPNFNGKDRTWTIAVKGEELTMSTQAAASGGSAELKWKRIK